MQAALSHPTQRSDTYSVAIAAPPSFVWQALADVESWPAFSPFALSVAKVADGEYRVVSPQGEIGLTSRFDEERGLLDHVVQVGDATVFIPYRVVANFKGSELIMTNVKAPDDTMDEYEEQLRWMRDELNGAKEYVERRLSSRTAGQSS